MGKKQPKLVLRESAVADATREWAPGAFLEMGAGTGHMSQLFLDRGFTGIAYDLGEDSREMIRANFAPYGDRARVIDSQALIHQAISFRSSGSMAAICCDH
ncbi:MULTISPECIES: hypothetical protein [Dyella]|uniref:Class I SAM-dependent methyltransferase n=2 Tax=Dyella TaxID=231454 RepID=A0A4R0Z1X2_9GAMM|nr:MULTISPECIES: hypothetical protein [Dyella]TBR40146.1 hypothetical protein EYV96_08245 [Dyella terrae]TCI12270.1 hypothetical protein EZM97_02625 [Dyella soli]